MTNFLTPLVFTILFRCQNSFFYDHVDDDKDDYICMIKEGYNKDDVIDNQDDNGVDDYDKMM